MAYRDYLYDTPPKREAQPNHSWEERLQSYREFVSSQRGLANVVGTIETLKNGGRDETGDRAIIIQSPVPLYYDLFMNGQQQAKAWMGTIREHQITDIPGSGYRSFDGRIRRRIVLEDATPLSKHDLKRWTAEKITNIMFHDYTEGILALLQEFDHRPAGEETVTIHDTYEHTDYVIIRHEMDENERSVAHISAPGGYEVSGHMPPMVPGLRRATGTWYGQDSSFINGIIGEDKRSIGEIHQLLKERVGDDVKYFVGKQLQSILLDEDHEFINRQPLPDRNKWLMKLYDERGVYLQHTTGINVFTGKGISEETTRKLLQTLEKAQAVLAPAHYHIEGAFSVGTWGCDMYADFSDIAQNRCFLGYTDY